MLIVVVFPAPLGPSSPKSSSVPTVKEIPSTAVKPSNVFTRFSTRMASTYVSLQKAMIPLFCAMGGTFRVFEIDPRLAFRRILQLAGVASLKAFRNMLAESVDLVQKHMKAEKTSTRLRPPLFPKDLRFGPRDS